MPRPSGLGKPRRGFPTAPVMVIVVLVVVVSAGFILSAQRLVNQVLPQRTVTVTVTDDNGNALGGASVGVQGSSASATTEPTGLAHLGLGSLEPGTYTLVVTDRGYMNTGVRLTIPDTGNPAPVAIQMPWAPPVGMFVWHSKSTLYEVMVISGGDPDYTLQGYDVEWHCFGGDWTKNDVTVTLGRDRLDFGGQDVPMGPGTISRSFVLNGPLPDTSQPPPAGTCVNGQNAW